MTDVRYPKPRPIQDSSRVVLTEFPRPEPWTENAACSQYPADIWYPPTDRGGSTAHAVKVCGGCDVKVECLEYAMRTGEPWGIWGGLDPEQRRKVRRRGAA